MNTFSLARVCVDRFIYGFSLFADHFYLWKTLIVEDYCELNKLSLFYFLDFRSSGGIDDDRVKLSDYPNWFIDHFLPF